MEAKLEQLKALLREGEDLASAVELLSWDQATYMPPGGAPARARQLALLERLAHEKRTDPAIGELLEGLRPYESGLPYDSDDASLIRVARRAYERAVKVPPAFMGEYYGQAAASYDVWTRARPADDFQAMQPYLEKMLDLSRQYSEHFPGYEHVADPLIDRDDHGITVSTLRPLFAQLAEELMPIVQAITAQPPADNTCLRQNFPEAQQLAFGLDVARRLGYDFERGRQDKTLHPFMTKFSLGDVRIATHVNEHDLSDALFSTVHEAGHAMYEQGIRREFEATPLATGASAGVHESQSRLWENMVGRSRGFWQFFYPKLQAAFPEQFQSVGLDTFYRAVNRVERTILRWDADEVTYNLHIFIRFELELAMLEGRLAVRDLPDAWRERYQANLGVLPPDDRDGVMQDVHWFSGFVGGAFQGYTLGNLMGAQFYEAALRAHPEITREMERGEFGALRQWLTENIYRHGAKYTAAEIVERATGGQLSVKPYIRYLRTKFGELHSL